MFAPVFRAGADAPSLVPGHLLPVLSNLGAAMRARFDYSGAVEDLDAAIQLGRQAVAATDEDHPGRAMYLSNLGAALLARSEHSGPPADLDAAIQLGQRALAACPEDHPGRVMFLSNLGRALQRRFARDGSPEDLARVSGLG
jgi:tetratricopeptide (TPR) repeat protein